MYKRLNVSIPEELDKWITEHNLSPSTLLQVIATQKMETWTELNKDRSDEIKNWAEKCNSLRIQLQKRIDFIEKEGLISKYEQEN